MIKYLQHLTLLIFFTGTSLSTVAQNFSFTEPESKQAVKNLQDLIKGVDNRFASIKTNTKLTTSGRDSSFKASISIFPAKAKSTAFIHFKNQFVYYIEETEADIYTVTQALKAVLRGKDCVEIIPEQPGTYTVTSRAFKTKDAVVSISYIEEKEKTYTQIFIVKAAHYNTKDLNKKVGGNWEPEKKGLGFQYKSNGKDSVLITNVFEKSPADKAGLKAGDLITAVDNEPLTQYSTDQVANLLAISPDKINFTCLRSGKVLKAVLQKDFAYKYDKTCLSGDCVNGNGTAMSNILSNVLMEGKFSEGQLVDGSWYYNAKSPQEKGVLFRKGKVKLNRFFTGNSYDPSKPDGGWWYQVINHDVVQNFSITEKTLNGYVMCYSNKTVKYLWEGEFENGKKSGDFAEYLYDKGFYWSYHINGSEKTWHKLKRLTSDKIENRWLNDDFLTYNEAAKSWSGWFLASLVNSNLSSMTRLENVSSYSDIETKALASKSTSASGNGGTVKTTPGKPTEPQVKHCGHCDGYGVTYSYLCSTCNNTGWTNTFIGPNSYSLVRQICCCVGCGVRGYTYMKRTLDSRKKICDYCNGKGILK